MQLKDVNVVRVELAQGVVEAVHHTRRGEQLTAAVDIGFRGEHDAVTRRRFDSLANNGLGAIGRGGIQEIDPHLQGLTYKRNGIGLCLASAQSQSAITAAAESGNTDA